MLSHNRNTPTSVFSPPNEFTSLSKPNIQNPFLPSKQFSSTSLSPLSTSTLPPYQRETTTSILESKTWVKVTPKTTKLPYVDIGPNNVVKNIQNMKRRHRGKGRQKQKSATAMRGKLIHAILHEDKSLENEVFQTLEASKETGLEEEAHTSPPPPTPFYPTIASKLVDMPAPLPTIATEPSLYNSIPTESNTQPSKQGSAHRRRGTKREKGSKGFKKFKQQKQTFLKKRRPFKSAYPKGTSLLQTPIPDDLVGPVLSEETSKPLKEEEPMSRRKAESVYGDTFMMSLNDQQFAVQPNIVYDPSPSQSTGSIIKELFSDQIVSRNFQPVRESNFHHPTPMPTYQTPQTTPYYQEITASPWVYEPQPTPHVTSHSSPQTPGNYGKSKSHSSFSPTPTKYNPTIQPFKVNPRPQRQSSQTTMANMPTIKPFTASPSLLINVDPSYSPTPTAQITSQDLHHTPAPPPRPRKHRVKKQSAIGPPQESESCSCLSPPLSPRCSLACPAVASDRQGLGAQVAILEHTQEHNQDPTQSHAFQ